MKRCQLLIFLSLSLAINLSAQNSISLGPQIGIATHISKYHSFATGVILEYTHRASSNIAFRASIGYNNFKSKFEGEYKSILPIRGGLQGFLTSRIFVLGEAGLAFYKTSDFPKESDFSFAVGPGYQLRISQHQFLEFSSTFNLFNYSPNYKYTWINLKVAYGFSWRNQQMN